MRVLVTGGSGRLGQGVINDLLANGHEAVNADRQRPGAVDTPHVRFIEAELTDVGQVAGALKGCDALIHLGAIPSPYSNPDEIVFANNTQATFAALQAASLLSVPRVAIASSVSAYGMAWAPKPVEPKYVPVDEAHPLLAHDPYALSKEVDERTAEMFHRRTGMVIAAMRFHWVARPEEHVAAAATVRSDPATHARNLWGYVDVRDAAVACRLAIECPEFGFEAFNVTAADTLCDMATDELIRRYLPATDLRSAISGTDSGFSLEKARRLLGWEPQHSWRKHISTP